MAGKGSGSSGQKPQTPAETTVEYTNAIDKIRDEMAKGKGRYVEVVGEFLTDYLQRRPEAGTAILAKGKSIAGSLEEMKKEARKAAVNGCAVLDDETAFGIVLKYFGIEGKDTSSGAARHLPLEGKAFAETARQTSEDPFDLDALLGGI